MSKFSDFMAPYMNDLFAAYFDDYPPEQRFFDQLLKTEEIRSLLRTLFLERRDGKLVVSGFVVIRTRTTAENLERDLKA